jgi:hypothetical protein
MNSATASTLRVLLGEAIEDAVEKVLRMLAQRWHLGDFRRFGERLEPTDLDQDPVPDEAIFAEDRSKIVDFRRISTVDRGECIERGQVHGQAAPQQV